ANAPACLPFRRRGGGAAAADRPLLRRAVLSRPGFLALLPDRGAPRPRRTRDAPGRRLVRPPPPWRTAADQAAPAVPRHCGRQLAGGPGLRMDSSAPLRPGRDGRRAAVLLRLRPRPGSRRRPGGPDPARLSSLAGPRSERRDRHASAGLG